MYHERVALRCYTRMNVCVAGSIRTCEFVARSSLFGSNFSILSFYCVDQNILLRIGHNSCWLCASAKYEKRIVNAKGPILPKSSLRRLRNRTVFLANDASTDATANLTWTTNTNHVPRTCCVTSEMRVNFAGLRRSRQRWTWRHVNGN